MALEILLPFRHLLTRSPSLTTARLVLPSFSAPVQIWKYKYQRRHISNDRKTEKIPDSTLTSWLTRPPKHWRNFDRIQWWRAFNGSQSDVPAALLYIDNNEFDGALFSPDVNPPWFLKWTRKGSAASILKAIQKGISTKLEPGVNPAVLVPLPSPRDRFAPFNLNVLVDNAFSNDLTGHMPFLRWRGSEFAVRDLLTQVWNQSHDISDSVRSRLLVGDRGTGRSLIMKVVSQQSAQISGVRAVMVDFSQVVLAPGEAFWIAARLHGDKGEYVDNSPICHYGANIRGVFFADELQWLFQEESKRAIYISRQLSTILTQGSTGSNILVASGSSVLFPLFSSNMEIDLTEYFSKDHILKNYCSLQAISEACKYQSWWIKPLNCFGPDSEEFIAQLNQEWRCSDYYATSTKLDRNLFKWFGTNPLYYRQFVQGLPMNFTRHQFHQRCIKWLYHLSRQINGTNPLTNAALLAIANENQAILNPIRSFWKKIKEKKGSEKEHEDFLNLLRNIDPDDLKPIKGARIENICRQIKSKYQVSTALLFDNGILGYNLRDKDGYYGCCYPLVPVLLLLAE